MLIRQTDGSMFGAWLDIDDSPTTLMMEHYAPQAAASGFAGKYDLVGGYVGGQQYKGVTTITPRNRKNAYNLDTTYSLDEMFPDEVPSRSRGIALASGSKLGYTYTFENVVACDVTLYTFEPDGSIQGEYDLGTGRGAFTGTRKSS